MENYLLILPNLLPSQSSPENETPSSEMQALKTLDSSLEMASLPLINLDHMTYSHCHPRVSGTPLPFYTIPNTMARVPARTRVRSCQAPQNPNEFKFQKSYSASQGALVLSSCYPSNVPMHTHPRLCAQSTIPSKIHEAPSFQ